MSALMSIVEEIRQDREKGARRLQSEYKAGLLTLARRFCADESDAEELVNSTFAEVVANIDRYLEQSAFFGWMSRILINLRNKAVRRKENSMVSCVADIPDEVPDEEACNKVFNDVDSGIVRDIIESLPDEMKGAIVMHYFMDMPVKEIARVLIVPEGTVKWRLHCARQALTAKLGATIKKPVVALVAIGLFLAASAAAAVAVGLRGAEAANRTATETANQNVAEAANQTAMATLSQTATADGESEGAGATGFIAAENGAISSTKPNGDQPMTRNRAAAAALTAAFAVAGVAPLAASYEAVEPPYGAASSIATEYIELDARAVMSRDTNVISLYTCPRGGVTIIVF